MCVHIYVSVRNHRHGSQDTSNQDRAGQDWAKTKISASPHNARQFHIKCWSCPREAFLRLPWEIHFLTKSCEKEAENTEFSFHDQ